MGIPSTTPSGARRFHRWRIWHCWHPSVRGVTVGKYASPVWKGVRSPRPLSVKSRVLKSPLLTPPPPTVTMPSHPSFDSGEDEDWSQRVQHGGSGVAKWTPPPPLLLLPFLLSCVLIDTESLQYGLKTIEPLMEMLLGRDLQERAFD